MDFSLSPEIEDYRMRIRAFVDKHLLPLETDRASYDEHENIKLDLLDGLREKTKSEGLWALQMPKALGGQGLNIAGIAEAIGVYGRQITDPSELSAAVRDALASGRPAVLDVVIDGTV